MTKIRITKEFYDECCEDCIEAEKVANAEVVHCEWGNGIRKIVAKIRCLIGGYDYYILETDSFAEACKFLRREYEADYALLCNGL